jgi:hypothetical protein
LGLKGLVVVVVVVVFLKKILESGIKGLTELSTKYIF